MRTEKAATCVRYRGDATPRRCDDVRCLTEHAMTDAQESGAKGKKPQHPGVEGAQSGSQTESAAKAKDADICVLLQK
jgi:hypothetical protein